MVPGVLGWLEAIWWNLLVNALEFGGPGCRIELAWLEQGDSLRFEVRDNGPGVPEPMRGKLFREFHRLHEDREVPGLGLSIVQRLVELQGGGCGYEQPPQGGSCFFFTLPSSDGNPPAQT
jgi:signal transduction histidine kinase